MCISQKSQTLGVCMWKMGSLSYMQPKSELYITPTLYPISLIESHVGRLEDRQAATYTAHSASQECINTQAAALGWEEMGAGMNVEARDRPHSSRSAQETFILRQTWEKSSAVIRPMEGGGERRLITSCLEKRSVVQIDWVWLNVILTQF